MDTRSQNENGKVKHVWTPAEDAKLIECLQELVNSGRWRADNGTFRPGYLAQLEKYMHDRIPRTKIKASPHIESRVKIWRKQYHAIAEMLSNKGSGFGWSDTDKCIICELPIFEDWVKSHPNAAGLRGKRFPYLEELSIVFGKDRANGLGAESPADAVEEIGREDTPNMNGLDEAPKDFTEPRNCSQPARDVRTQLIPNAGAGSSSRRTKRRRSNEGPEEIAQNSFGETIQKFGNFFDEANKNIKEIVGLFKFMTEDHQRKMMVSEEMMKMEELSLSDRMRAAVAISNDSMKTHAFFNFPPETRVYYVQLILNGVI